MELKRRDTLKAIGGIAALATVGSTSSLAQHNDVDPDLFGVDSLQEAIGLEFLQGDQYFDNQTLESVVQGLESDNPELVTVDQIGESNQGRPLYSLAIEKHADCPTVMGVGEQHGNELLGAEALLGVVQFLTSGDSRAESILDNVSVHVVPRANPDGFVARQRQNVDTDAPEDDPEAGIDADASGIFAASDPGIGWDINRYHSHDWTDHPLYEFDPDEYPENPVPEAVAIIEMVQDVDPVWVIDFHRQGDYEIDFEGEFDLEEQLADDDDEEEEEMDDYPPDPDDPGEGTLNTGSIFWPINPDVSDDVVELSQQVVLSMFDHLEQQPNVNNTRYPGGTFSGIARNAHGLAGYGSVLYELDSSTIFSREDRTRQPFEAMLAITEATADGSLYDIDADRIDELNERVNSSGV